MTQMVSAVRLAALWPCATKCLSLGVYHAAGAGAHSQAKPLWSKRSESSTYAGLGSRREILARVGFLVLARPSGERLGIQNPHAHELKSLWS